MLKVEGLSKNFGGLLAVNGFDLEVRSGEFVGLIGPNGAGKTTVFNLITGYLHPSSGRIFFEGIEITAKSPHAIARMGIARTFQFANIFSEFTTLENVIAASYLKVGLSPFGGIFRPKMARAKLDMVRECAEKILEMVGLGDVANIKVSVLPYGYKKILTVAMALAVEPKLLLLDEPFGGMNPREVAEATQVIRRLRENGLTILMIEHNMRVTMELCERIVVLNFGTKIAEGPPAVIRDDPRVIEAYLGRRWRQDA